MHEHIFLETPVEKSVIDINFLNVPIVYRQGKHDSHSWLLDNWTKRFKIVQTLGLLEPLGNQASRNLCMDPSDLYFILKTHMLSTMEASCGVGTNSHMLLLCKAESSPYMAVCHRESERASVTVCGSATTSWISNTS